MADTAIAITAGTGTNVDTRTEATNGNHRQVVVLGDPATNAGVAPVDATNGLSVNVTNASLTVASHAVTNAGTFATQATLAAETTKVIGVAKIGDGTNTATVKAASTAALATDTALVVAISPNSSGSVAQASTTSGQTGALVQGAVTTAAPSYTTAQTSPLSLDAAGNLRVVPLAVTATANGATASRINAAASTNATSLKASAGQLYTIDVFNAAAYNVFLKLYNKASAPTVGTDTPVMTIPVQAGGGYSKTWPMGLPFATGIAYAITKLQADSDTTVVVAGDLTGNTTWI